MYIRYARWLLACVVCLPAVLASALERDEVRGELVNVDDDVRSIEVKIEETGDAVPTRIGRTEQYRIDESTNIEFDIDQPGSLLRTRMMQGFEDLAPGQEVVLNYRTLGPELIAVSVTPIAVYTARMDSSREADGSMNRNGDSSMDSSNQYAGVDYTDSGRDRLPSSASVLPSLAIVGLGLCILALTFRLTARSSAG